MTRKDYELLACVMRMQKPQRGNDTPMNMGEAGQAEVRYEQWLADCRALSAALKQDNARFDQQRFLDACGWRP